MTEQPPKQKNERAKETSRRTSNNYLARMKAKGLKRFSAFINPRFEEQVREFIKKLH